MGREIQCKLDKLMASRGLTQLDLKRELGLSPSTVRALQNNRFSRIDKTSLEKLLDYFEIDSLDQFFTILNKEDA
ncbi:helix-turn-helix domain-containing protein [Phormidium sp. CCY1219]|uniref:helix-turn-helix domain-containing protein n=1 Tax=Phormidium sp. CCY1219 TaxID=2886104 RepID=UPI002D1F37F6|nr:helix-turn-helix transcriptional regulator [Phormidium sp. CCY1219]MEB3828859.1 helix-turn-helix transcriptional regulator [Phormidium sp. CCY1219]